MAKQNTKAKAQAPKPHPLITARIDRLHDYEGSNIKAFASATIGGANAIHGIKVMDSQKGLFVSMPQNSYKDANGETKYTDIFHAVTAEARTELNDQVMAAYEQALEEQQAEAESEDQGVVQSM